MAPEPATKYRLVSPRTPAPEMILRVADNAFIPLDPANRDYQEFLRWKESGNEPDPAIPFSEPPPPDISDRQFFQILAMHGLITQEEALAAVKTGEIPALFRTYVDHIDDPQEQFAVRMLLSGATTFERRHPLIDRLGDELLKLTPKDIDDLWREAAGL